MDSKQTIIAVEGLTSVGVVELKDSAKEKTFVKSRSLVDSFNETSDNMDVSVVCVWSNGLKMRKVEDVILSHTGVNQKIRPFYLVPFLVNFILLFSTVPFTSILVNNSPDEALFPIPSWVFFMTLAIFSPFSIVLTRLFPQEFVAVVIGGLFSFIGYTWTGFTSNWLVFGLFTAIGICVSLHAAFIALSSYFERLWLAKSMFITVTCSILVTVVCPALSTLITEHQTKIFLYIAPLTLFTSWIPAIMHFVLGSTSVPDIESDQTPVKNPNCYMILKLERENISTPWKSLNPLDASTRHDQRTKRASKGGHWLIQYILSILVWLSWGAGVDLTWLNLLSYRSYQEASVAMISFQVIMSLVIVLIKLITLKFNRTGPPLNFGANYFMLSLQGSTGILLIFFPQRCDPLHPMLLFAFGLALQFDDLSDIFPRETGDDQKQNSSTNQEAIEKKFAADQTIGFCNICRLMLHLFSLILMSFLAMIVSLHISNFVVYLTTLRVFSPLCTSSGLVVISAFSLCVSFIRPNLFISTSRAQS